jgi:hypothetical protein
MKLNGRSRPGAAGRNTRVACAICGRVVGAHSWGRGGGHLRASLHRDTTGTRCAGSLCEARKAA